MVTQSAAQEPYLFVSYASADRERVMPVVAALERAGVPVWLDQQGIAGGENYAREIADAIKGSAAFILMASAASLSSRNCKQEIALGWRFERLYLPLLLEPVAIPDELAYWLEAAQWVEVLDKAEEEWLPSVLAALSSLGIAPRVAVQREVRLAGREKELALLCDTLANAKEGRGGLVLISGEAGIGKTALAEVALLEAARQGFVVLVGRCFDLAETPPYGPWIDLFAHLPSRAERLPLPPAFAEVGTVGPVANQMALFVQAEGFLKALATRSSVVVLLEDLHWADPASLDVLRFLSQSMPTMPILLLLTFRSEELTHRHPLYQLLPHLRRAPATYDLSLGPIDDGAVRSLVAERYGLPDVDAGRLVAYLGGRADGNPLFVGELLHSLEEIGTVQPATTGWRLGSLEDTGVPPALRQVIDARVARLGEEARRLLAVASVIGHEFPLAALTAVGEADEDAALGVVERGLEARLLIEAADGERVRFAHALIREALYESLPAIRRRRIHRRVGETLAALPSTDPDAVAYHFQRADDERALSWLLEAGERAQAAYAWTTAAARFDAALALMEANDADAGERGWLLLRSSRLVRYAEVARARALADKAVTLGRAANDGALVAFARFQRGLLACMGGDVADGLPELEAGADALASLSDAERAHFAARAASHAAGIAATARVPEGRAMVAMMRGHVGRFAAARELGEGLVVGVDGGDTEMVQGVRDAYLGLGEAYAALGMAVEAAAAYATAHDAFLGAGHHVLACNVSMREMEMVALPYRTEERAGRRSLAERGEAEWTRASGALPASIPPRFARLPLLIIDGQWEEAGRLAAAGSAETRGLVQFRTMALRYLAVLSGWRGDAERAWWAVREGLPAGSATAPGTVWTFDVGTVLQRVAIALALDAGDLPTAKQWLEAHDRWLAWSGAVLGLSEGQALWAQYHQQAGESEQAREYAERALAHATAPRQPLALLAAHRLLGEVDTDAGQFADAETHLATALALAEACEAPYERALTMLAIAELRAATGEHGAARTLLDEVRAVCEPIGAQPALARADTLAARLA
ncbi:MAG: AAA family ATPase [Thermomicrobiales bacterium]